MRKYNYLIILLALNLSVSAQSEYISENRAMLKDYFLYCCIMHGYNNIEIQKIDHSGAVFIDLLQYDLKALHKTDSLANYFINSIKPTPYENKNTKGIIILSIEEYKSRRLSKFIKSLDVYMIKK